MLTKWRQTTIRDRFSPYASPCHAPNNDFEIGVACELLLFLRFCCVSFMSLFHCWGDTYKRAAKKKDFSFVIMRSVDIFLATFFYEFVRLQQNAKMESSERSILGKNKNKNIHFCFDGRLHRRCRCSWTSLRTLKHHIENILSREQRKRTPWNSPRRKLIVYMRVTETEESRKKERERAESTTTYMAIDASILENIK